MQRRTAAKLAFMIADADYCLRRALLCRHRSLRVPLAVGQKCFYWRDAGAPRLQKNRWRGPAIVLMREDDGEGRPHTYWIVHSTSLLRCAPEHVRAVVEDDGKDFNHNLQAAQEAAANIRARSTTQFADIRATPPPPIDVDSDDDEEMGIPPAGPPAPPTTVTAAPPVTTTAAPAETAETAETENGTTAQAEPEAEAPHPPTPAGMPRRKRIKGKQPEAPQQTDQEAASSSVPKRQRDTNDPGHACNLFVRGLACRCRCAW